MFCDCYYGYAFGDEGVEDLFEEGEGVGVVVDVYVGEGVGEGVVGESFGFGEEGNVGDFGEGGVEGSGRELWLSWRGGRACDVGWAGRYGDAFWEVVGGVFEPGE